MTNNAELTSSLSPADSMELANLIASRKDFEDEDTYIADILWNLESAYGQAHFYTNEDGVGSFIHPFTFSPENQERIKEIFNGTKEDLSDDEAFQEINKMIMDALPIAFRKMLQGIKTRSEVLNELSELYSQEIIDGERIASMNNSRDFAYALKIFGNMEYNFSELGEENFLPSHWVLQCVADELHTYFFQLGASDFNQPFEFEPTESSRILQLITTSLEENLSETFQVPEGRDPIEDEAFFRANEIIEMVKEKFRKN